MPHRRAWPVLWTPGLVLEFSLELPELNSTVLEWSVSSEGKGTTLTVHIHACLPQDKGSEEVNGALVSPGD